MSDLISRQAAIDVIDEWIKAFRENGHRESAADARFIQDGIIQLPSVQGWIPETERLPEEFGRYIVTRISADDGVGRVDIIWYSTFYGWDRDERPVAWMPLPEPYKEMEGAEDARRNE